MERHKSKHSESIASADRGGLQTSTKQKPLDGTILERTKKRSSETQMKRSGDQRVVVTGLGLVTPLATGLERNREALMARRLGIGPITRFDVTDFATRIGGEVRDFDPLDWIEKRDVTKMDLFIQYAI